VFACYPATDNENWTLRLCLLPVEIEAEEMPSAGVRVTSMMEQPVCSSPRLWPPDGADIAGRDTRRGAAYRELSITRISLHGPWLQAVAVRAACIPWIMAASYDRRSLGCARQPSRALHCIRP
jgi:hypothetical protein